MIPFRLVVACSCGRPTFPSGCNSVTSFHTVHVSTWHAMNTVAPLSLRRYCWLTSGQCTASTARDQHRSSSTGFGQPRVARQEIELRARAAFTPVTVTVRNEVKLWGTKAPPTQQPAPRRGPHAHTRRRTPTHADARGRTRPTASRRQTGPTSHVTRPTSGRARLLVIHSRAVPSVPAQSPAAPHAPQLPSLIVGDPPAWGLTGSHGVPWRGR